MTPLETLQKYWGHSGFRPMQEDIIQSVLAGHDTLALLPTGGGKSICFQVPGLVMDGMCLVISPLIALMKDQVENLRKKGILAYAIYSGMHRSEIDLIFNNCAYGRARFLYVSPERLETKEFVEKISEWKINLLAVDEAHCISQWGYDFRPPYLRIAAIRELLPGVPVLALTATATPVVVSDIQQRLDFSRGHVFQKSFSRDNLAYLVLKEEDKRGRLLRIAGKTAGTGIVYVRNRKRTAEIAQFLNKHGISASFYHAGLDNQSRAKRQDEWISGKVRVMVATNAFGMGIDKPDVRFVVHIDLPDTLEAYFQEAGRAGRDEKNSYSVILYESSDLEQLVNSFHLNYPEPDLIRKVYMALANYGNIPMGGGKDQTFPFEMGDFCRQYRFQALQVNKVLEFLEKEAYLLRSTDLQASTRIHLNISREELYDFQLRYPNLDTFVKLLLRSYGGLFSDFVSIRESELAVRAELSVAQVTANLEQMNKLRVIQYIPSPRNPELTFCRERLDEKHLLINEENYFKMKKRALEKLEAVIAYVQSALVCRSKLLLAYFGEKGSKPCGKCDICLKPHHAGVSDSRFQSIYQQLMTLLTTKPSSLQAIAGHLDNEKEENLIKVCNWLIDNQQIKVDKDGLLHWR